MMTKMRALFLSVLGGQPIGALRSRDRGTSLIEVLVASAVMAVLMVGVLQIFSLALITNYGSAARTDLTYRAQQVVENLRMIQYFAKNGNTGPATDAGITATASGTGSYSIPPTASGTVSYTNVWWTAAGVVVDDTDPFRITYSVTDLAGTAGAPVWAGTFYSVVVTATPVNAPGLAAPANAKLYMGGDSSSIKQVTYAAQIAK